MAKKIKWMLLAAFILAPSWVLQVPQVSANKKMGVEEHIKELKSKLSLTSEQESQVRSIIEDKKRKMEEAKQGAHERIRDVLTDSQRAKFNDLILKKEKEDY